VHEDDAASDAEQQPGARPRLPRRPPRSLFVHWGVDTAVAFLALIVLGLFLGARWQTVVVVAVAIGVLAAPFTRRAEERALAARDGD
jgi:hypothetical protein